MIGPIRMQFFLFFRLKKQLSLLRELYVLVRYHFISAYSFEMLGKVSSMMLDWLTLLHILTQLDGTLVIIRPVLQFYCVFIAFF